MTPSQLAVEADALLSGGRTPEEVARMQHAAKTPEVEHVEAMLREHRITAEQVVRMLDLVQRGSLLHHHLFDLQRATQRILALVDGMPTEHSALADLRAGLSRRESESGASVPRPCTCTREPPFEGAHLSTCPQAQLGTRPALPGA